jgi:hypothetical protein
VAISSDVAATTRPDLQPARGYKKKRKALKTVVKANPKYYGKKKGSGSKHSGKKPY